MREQQKENAQISGPLIYNWNNAFCFLAFPPRVSFAFCAKVGHRMFHPPSELCWIAGSILEMLVGFCLGLTYGLQVLPCLSFSSNGWHFHTIPLDP